MKKCPAKHVSYSPSEWRCPKCEADNRWFYIEHETLAGDPLCNLLHDNDFVVCHNCNGEWIGKELSKEMQIKNTVIVLEVVMPEKRMLSMEELVAVKNILNAKGIKQK